MMARIRSIHPEQWTDEDFVQLSPWARLLTIAVRNECDDQGVFLWKPLTLKMRLFPADNVDVAALLDEMIEHNVVRRFEVDGKLYGVVRDFRIFQRPKKPNDIYPLPKKLRKYAGFPDADEVEDDGEASPAVDGAEFPTSSELVPHQCGTSSPPVRNQFGTSSPPVRNQFPTGGENLPQMERREEGEEGRGEGEERREEGEEDADPPPEHQHLAGRARAPDADDDDGGGGATSPPGTLEAGQAAGAGTHRPLYDAAEAVDVRDAVIEAIGVDIQRDRNPAGWLGSEPTHVVGQWLGLGLTRGEILGVVGEVMARRGTRGPPGSLAYFTAAMREAAGRKQAPQLTPIAGGHHGTGTGTRTAGDGRTARERRAARELEDDLAFARRLDAARR